MRIYTLNAISMFLTFIYLIIQGLIYRRKIKKIKLALSLSLIMAITTFILRILILVIPPIIIMQNVIILIVHSIILILNLIIFTKYKKEIKKED